MNIRVDLPTPIKDGTEVVFRSPVDCSQVTGLIVYHNEESKEFAFTDAHGNNVGDVDHLFAENVVVKVILDVTAGMAFVQNADTNAYLEQRFKKLEDQIGTGGGIAPTPDYYFAIDYDGVVSLQSDYQAGGNKNAELPEVIVIPEVIGGTAVSALADYTFQKNNRVKSVTIPKSILKIPIGFANEAFNLEEVKGTDNVEVIGNGAFRKCGIKKALFPKLKSFEGTNNFNYAVNLTIVDIGDSITEIPRDCFNGCESLSLVLGGASVTSIVKQAFKTTRGLKNLPLLSNVKSIGDSAFFLSRVNYDWWNASFSSVGANGTPKKYNPTDWWSGCTYTPCVNPLGSTFSQYNPAWRDIILGQSNKTYEYGCVEFSAAHIYSALTGVKFDSPEVFINDIVGSIDNGRLLELTGGKTEYEGDDMEAWLSALGLVCERITGEDGGYNSTNLQKVYDALAQGALVFTGAIPFHVSVIYGVAENGEMLVLDSNPFKYTIGNYEAGTYQQPIWSFATQGTGFMIVRKN